MTMDVVKVGEAGEEIVNLLIKKGLNYGEILVVLAAVADSFLRVMKEKEEANGN